MPKPGSSIVVSRGVVIGLLLLGSRSWHPGRHLCGTLRDADEPVDRHRHPRSHDAVGPRHPYLRTRGRPQAHLGPPELAAGVSAADDELAPLDEVPSLHLDLGPDRVDVAARL